MEKKLFQTETVAELLKSPDIDVNLIDKIHNGWNALHKAVLQDNVDTVFIWYLIKLTY